MDAIADMTKPEAVLMGIPREQPKYLCQHGIGEHAELITLVEGWHAAWCVRHKYVYVPSYARTAQAHGRPAYFEKIQLLLKLCTLAAENALIVYLDADCLIVRTGPESDFENALLEGVPVGMNFMPPHRGSQFGHFNSGVIVIRNTEKARVWLQRAWYMWPLPKLEHPPGAYDELALNLALWAEYKEHGMGFVRLPAKWNCWAINEKGVDAPIVRAWHGMDKRIVRRRMAEVMVGLGKGQPA